MVNGCGAMGTIMINKTINKKRREEYLNFMSDLVPL